MVPQLKIACWKGETHWLGKFIDHPEIMSQDETLAKHILKYLGLK